MAFPNQAMSLTAMLATEILILQEHPFTKIENYEKGTVKWTGFLFDIVDELAGRMNFKYVYILIGSKLLAKESSNC